ncbi:homeobox and leucine zipper encoding b isoform 1-T2 [Menidia menidia]
MRHCAEGETPGLKETPVSDTTPAPVSESLSLNTPVCLPLISESKKLVWVRSDQIDLRLNEAAELDKAFDRFPYLSARQTAALARRCSLHPDQVRVWFMAQRLRYGISWDHGDICEVWSQFCPGRGGGEEIGEPRSRSVGVAVGGKGRKRKEREKVGEPGGRKGSQSRNAEKNKTKKVKQSNNERAAKVEVVAGKEGNKGQRKGSEAALNTVTKRGVRKPVVQKSREGSGVGCDSLLFSPPLTRTPEDPAALPSSTSDAPPTPLSGGLRGKTQEEARLMGDLLLDLANHNSLLGPVNKFEDPAEVSSSLPVSAPGSPKTQAQLAMMRAAFVRCQYPDGELYGRLVEAVGVPRHALLQWFSDMRYYVKKMKPRWMTAEQHRAAVANVKYQQYLNRLAKQRPGRAKTEPCGEGRHGN